MTTPASYFDTSSWDPADVLSGGSRMIPISTPSGEFRVWTKRVGTNPDIKVLLLHGGPGATDELYECFDVWFPGAGIEYYYYDQLGSFRSDVRSWLEKTDGVVAARMRTQLTTWRDNHPAFMKLVNNSPVLSEAVELSANLSRVAAIGLEAMESSSNRKKRSAAWKQSSLETCKQARAQGGRCDLQIVDAIESMVMQVN